LVIQRQTAANEIDSTSTPKENDVKKGEKAAKAGKANAADALQLRSATGKLAFLRVHNVGTGFGPPSDFIDVEVVIGIKQVTGGFGFKLRNDTNGFAHQGMLDLLRDAFNADTAVNVEYQVDPGEFGKVNGTIIRVTRRK
jgi:hypothetical protein